MATDRREAQSTYWNRETKKEILMSKNDLLEQKYEGIDRYKAI